MKEGKMNLLISDWKPCIQGTYCKEQGKTGEWNVSISSMDCIPTTTIFVTGGWYKVENNKLNI